MVIPATSSDWGGRDARGSVDGRVEQVRNLLHCCVSVMQPHKDTLLPPGSLRTESERVSRVALDSWPYPDQGSSCSSSSPVRSPTACTHCGSPSGFAAEAPSPRRLLTGMSREAATAVLQKQNSVLEQQNKLLQQMNEGLQRKIGDLSSGTALPASWKPKQGENVPPVVLLEQLAERCALHDLGEKGPVNINVPRSESIKLDAGGDDLSNTLLSEKTDVNHGKTSNVDQGPDSPGGSPRNADQPEMEQSPNMPPRFCENEVKQRRSRRTKKSLAEHHSQSGMSEESQGDTIQPGCQAESRSQSNESVKSQNAKEAEPQEKKSRKTELHRRQEKYSSGQGRQEEHGGHDGHNGHDGQGRPRPTGDSGGGKMASLDDEQAVKLRSHSSSRQTLSLEECQTEIGFQKSTIHSFVVSESGKDGESHQEEQEQQENQGWITNSAGSVKALGDKQGSAGNKPQDLMICAEEGATLAAEAKLLAEKEEALRRIKETRGGALQRQLAEFEQFSKLSRREKHEYTTKRNQSERMMHQQQLDMLRQETLKQAQQDRWISAVQEQARSKVVQEALRIRNEAETTASTASPVLRRGSLLDSHWVTNHLERLKEKPLDVHQDVEKLSGMPMTFPESSVLRMGQLDPVHAEEQIPVSDPACEPSRLLGSDTGKSPIKINVQEVSDAENKNADDKKSPKTTRKSNAKNDTKGASVGKKGTGASVIGVDFIALPEEDGGSDKRKSRMVAPNPKGKAKERKSMKVVANLAKLGAGSSPRASTVEGLAGSKTEPGSKSESTRLSTAKVKATAKAPSWGVSMPSASTTLAGNAKGSVTGRRSLAPSNSNSKVGGASTGASTVVDKQKDDGEGAPISADAEPHDVRPDDEVECVNDAAAPPNEEAVKAEEAPKTEESAKTSDRPESEGLVGSTESVELEHQSPASVTNDGSNMTDALLTNQAPASDEVSITQVTVTDTDKHSQEEVKEEEKTTKSDKSAELGPDVSQVGTAASAEVLAPAAERPDQANEKLNQANEKPDQAKEKAAPLKKKAYAAKKSTVPAAEAAENQKKEAAAVGFHSKLNALKGATKLASKQASPPSKDPASRTPSKDPGSANEQKRKSVAAKAKPDLLRRK
eukprot:gnl/MRDRNA2_/MRDRNA2_32450_c0_seq1.p1 gnl/MRDRNA2_/MRDRNA2_32450_c0~~gnl/MRDRNA2_/MRDRNA2_32450_c0_seq1.p1  ORF type:complete len:1115 (+),score=284.89 gnl/MRDRNA2_/MRDRNA2_32450_c0_seq1:59-3403(+)